MPNLLVVLIVLLVVLLIFIGGMLLNLYLYSRGVLFEKRFRWHRYGHYT